MFSVPKDLRENLRYRRHILQRAAKDSALQLALTEACRRDPIFWIDTFVWQFNSKKQDAEVGPFICWPFQEKALHRMLWCIKNSRSFLVEKSREMGGTYLSILALDYQSLFFNNKKFLVISRNAEAVDNAGDPDSIFWKLDYVHQFLPTWMKKTIDRRKMYFSFATNSKITGQASTGMAGVGGRATAVFCDEFSLVHEDTEVRRRTAGTTDCRIFNGTHQGLHTEFARLCEEPEIEKIQMHWSQHPDKIQGLYQVREGKAEILDKTFEFPPDYNFITDGHPSGGPFPGLRSVWYDKKAKEIGDIRGVAMELDINNSGSQSQFFDALTVLILKETFACTPYWEGELSYDRELGRPNELVPLKDGHLKLWLHLNAQGRPPPSLYTIGADLATGSGATNSCLSILNARTGEKVGEYANPNIVPDQLAPLAVALCWLFKSYEGEGAKFAWEGPGPGLIFGKKVLELGYQNIYWRLDEQKFSPKIAPDTQTAGWYPSPSNKRILLEDYRAALSSRQFLNRSWDALDETLAFRYSSSGHVEHGNESGGQDPSGARSNHGDRVIADALAWKMAKGLGTIMREEPTSTPPMGSMAWRRELVEQRETAARAWI